MMIKALILTGGVVLAGGLLCWAARAWSNYRREPSPLDVGLSDFDEW